MPDGVDDAIFSVSAFDNFSDTLDDLEQDLGQIEAAVQVVDPIEIDAAIAEAAADIAKLQGAIRSLPDEKNIDVDINDDMNAVSSQQMFNLMGIQTGEGLWQTNPFDPEEGGGLFDRGGGGDDLNRLRGMNSAQVQRIDLFGQADIFDGPLGADERRGGLGPLATGSIPSDPSFRHIREAIDEFKDLRLTMGFFMNLIASLIPLLGVYVGALPAAIAGVVALGAAAAVAAGALVGIAGLGLLAMATEGGEWNFSALKAEFQALIDTFLSAVTPLAAAFEPLMQDMMGKLARTFYEVSNQMRGLIDLTGTARSLTTTFLRSLGDVADATIAFAKVAMPVFTEILEFVGGVDWLGIFAEILSETLPMLGLLGAMLWAVLPPIYEISLGFLRIATVLTAVITSFFHLINIVPLAAQVFGALVSVMFVLITVSAVWSLLQTQAAQRVGLLIVAVYQEIAALHADIAAKIGSTAATVALTLATAAFLGLITFGLVPALGLASSGFGVLGNDIDSAASSLKDFNRIAGRTSLDGFAFDGAGDMTGPSYSNPSESTSSSQNGGVNATVVAPDQETGNAVANTFAWKNSGSDTENSDVENRLNSDI